MTYVPDWSDGEHDAWPRRRAKRKPILAEFDDLTVPNYVMTPKRLDCPYLSCSTGFDTHWDMILHVRQEHPQFYTRWKRNQTDI